MSSKRTIYERTRRHRIRDERKIDLVLRPWLEAKHKDVYTEFFLYFNKLEENNPTAFNLTKTNEFRAFIAGIICIICLYYLFVQRLFVFDDYILTLQIIDL
jgi:hypothetical protein